MKQTLLLVSIITILLSCNNNKPSNDTNADKKVVDNPNPMKNAVQDLEKQKEELGKLTPISLDELKAMAPETLLGAARTNLDANAAMGAGVVTADYELNENSSATLTIIDCAGPGGAGIYSMQYLGLININENNEEEFTRTVDYNGTKAFEHCDKTTNDCAFTYLTRGRFLITLEGANISVEELRKAAGALKIK